MRIALAANITRRVLEMFLEDKMTKQKLTYFGHVLRANSLKRTMPGVVSGKRKEGRPKTRWLDTIKGDTKMHIKN